MQLKRPRLNCIDALNLSITEGLAMKHLIKKSDSSLFFHMSISLYALHGLSTGVDVAGGLTVAVSLLTAGVDVNGATGFATAGCFTATAESPAASVGIATV